MAAAEWERGEAGATAVRERPGYLPSVRRRRRSCGAVRPATARVLQPGPITRRMAPGLRPPFPPPPEARGPHSCRRRASTGSARAGTGPTAGTPQLKRQAGRPRASTCASRRSATTRRGQRHNTPPYAAVAAAGSAPSGPCWNRRLAQAAGAASGADRGDVEGRPPLPPGRSPADRACCCMPASLSTLSASFPPSYPPAPQTAARCGRRRAAPRCATLPEAERSAANRSGTGREGGGAPQRGPASAAHPRDATRWHKRAAGVAAVEPTPLRATVRMPLPHATRPQQQRTDLNTIAAAAVTAAVARSSSIATVSAAAAAATADVATAAAAAAAVAAALVAAAAAAAMVAPGAFPRNASWHVYTAWGQTRFGGAFANGCRPRQILRLRDAGTYP
eukprot:354973-Chlamydomonas_euryale.AAC.8